MEIVRIGKHTVKVSLNTEEAKEYSAASYENLNDVEIKEAFSKLLLKIKEKVDFSYAGRKIFTEIYPSKDGGCEVFISCISLEAQKALNREKEQIGEIKKQKTLRSIYDFDILENLLSASYRLNEIHCKNESSVFYDEERKRYILVLEEIYHKDLKYAFLLEYSKHIKGTALNYIKEHYKCILKRDGIKILSALA